MKFKINLPNDYDSAEDSMAADAAGGYEAIAMAARAAGLMYVEEGDYGATWEGSEDQFAACVSALPAWAQRYAYKIED